MELISLAMALFQNLLQCNTVINNGISHICALQELAIKKVSTFLFLVIALALCILQFGLRILQSCYGLYTSEVALLFSFVAVFQMLKTRILMCLSCRNK